MAASKIAISLPDELLRLIDAECRRLRVNRSEFIRRAIRRSFKQAADEIADRAYARSYLEEPDDPELAEGFLKLAADAFSEDPWK